MREMTKEQIVLQKRAGENMKEYEVNDETNSDANVNEENVAENNSEESNVAE